MLGRKSLIHLGKLATSSNSSIVVDVRAVSTSASKLAKDNYKLLIVGGGSGGVTISAKFQRVLGANNVALVEPNDWHYYQPGWTLVASGLKTLESLRRQESSLIPKGVDWLKTKATEFDPENNSVTLANGQKIKYDFLVVATGIYINLDGIKGLREALKNDRDVVTMYSTSEVEKVFGAIKRTKEGEAIFTFPKPPIKCPGAPQKIMYLAEDYFRKNGVRDRVNVSYCTSLPVIFGVKKYAASLMEIVKSRNINLRTQTNLVEIDYKNKQAVFEKLDKPGTFVNYKYSLLHVCPPMRPVDEIKNSRLVDAAGFVDVSKETLQHKKYPNVFGIGDCTSLPTSKTAAAIASQSKVLFENLKIVMDGKQGNQLKYDGYTSCPLLTQYGKLILAEFDYDGNPMETFPIDQGKESRIMYYMKKDFMPELYWNSFLKGYWEGPAAFRSLFGK